MTFLESSFYFNQFCMNRPHGLDDMEWPFNPPAPPPPLEFLLPNFFKASEYSMQASKHLYFYRNLDQMSEINTIDFFSVTSKFI